MAGGGQDPSLVVLHPPTTPGDQILELRPVGPLLQFMGKRYIQTPIASELIQRLAQNPRLLPMTHSNARVPDHTHAHTPFSRAHGDTEGSCTPPSWEPLDTAWSVGTESTPWVTS